MTPANCMIALKSLTEQSSININENVEADKANVIHSIKEITGTTSTPLIGSADCPFNTQL